MPPVAATGRGALEGGLCTTALARPRPPRPVRGRRRPGRTANPTGLSGMADTLERGEFLFFEELTATRHACIESNSYLNILTTSVRRHGPLPRGPRSGSPEKTRARAAGSGTTSVHRRGKCLVCEERSACKPTSPTSFQCQSIRISPVLCLRLPLRGLPWQSNQMTGTVGILELRQSPAYVGLLAMSPGSTQSFLFQNILSTLIHRLHPLPLRGKWKTRWIMFPTILTGIIDVRLKQRCLGCEELSTTKQRTVQSYRFRSTRTIPAPLRHRRPGRSRRKTQWTVFLTNLSGTISIQLMARCLSYEGYTATEQRIVRSYLSQSTRTTPARHLPLFRMNAVIRRQPMCILIHPGMSDAPRREKCPN